MYNTEFPSDILPHTIAVIIIIGRITVYPSDLNHEKYVNIMIKVFLANRGVMKLLLK